MTAGLLGLVGVAAWEAATWLPQVSDWQRHYIGQRYLFALVTLVDAPIVQSLVVGAGLCLSSWSKTAASLERRSEVVNRDSSTTASLAER